MYFGTTVSSIVVIWLKFEALSQWWGTQNLCKKSSLAWFFCSEHKSFLLLLSSLNAYRNQVDYTVSYKPTQLKLKCLSWFTAYDEPQSISTSHLLTGHIHIQLPQSRGSSVYHNMAGVYREQKKKKAFIMLLIFQDFYRYFSSYLITLVNLFVL